MITNSGSGTNVHEIADGIYRINTPIKLPNGEPFSFNQYLLVDNEPLLFHTGPRLLFPLVSQAIAAVMPVERLRYVGLSHVEADECGSLNHSGNGAQRRTPVQPDCCIRVHQRSGRPAGSRVGRWRAACARSPYGAVVRYAACAAWLGMWPAAGLADRNIILWRPLHPAWPR